MNHSRSYTAHSIRQAPTLVCRRGCRPLLDMVCDEASMWEETLGYVVKRCLFGFRETTRIRTNRNVREGQEADRKSVLPSWGSPSVVHSMYVGCAKKIIHDGTATRYYKMSTCFLGCAIWDSVDYMLSGREETASVAGCLLFIYSMNMWNSKKRRSHPKTLVPGDQRSPQPSQSTCEKFVLKDWGCLEHTGSGTVRFCEVYILSVWCCRFGASLFLADQLVHVVFMDMNKFTRVMILAILKRRIILVAGFP